MTNARIVAIATATIGLAAGGTVLLSSGEPATITEAQVDAGQAPDAITLSNKTTGEHGYLADDATGRALLEAALVLRGREPTRIDLFAAQACESGLGFEVFDSVGYQSDCLPVGILPSAGE